MLHVADVITFVSFACMHSSLLVSPFQIDFFVPEAMCKSTPPPLPPLDLSIPWVGLGSSWAEKTWVFRAGFGLGRKNLGFSGGFRLCRKNLGFSGRENCAHDRPMGRVGPQFSDRV
jgi:hypothetical protein